MSLLDLALTLQKSLRENVQAMSLCSLVTKDGDTRVPKVHIWDLGYIDPDSKTFPAILIQPTEGADDLDSGVVSAEYQVLVAVGVHVGDDEEEFGAPSKWDGWIWLFTAVEAIRMFLLQTQTFGAYSLERTMKHGPIVANDNTRPILWGYVETTFSGAGIVRAVIDEKEW